MIRARAAFGVVLLIASAASAAEPSDLEPLAFLIGEWPAAEAGRPGVPSGGATFTWGLQDRVIVRTSHAEYPATAGRPGSRHDDLMIIYAVGGGGVRADYYDNEGHVIRYLVSFPARGQAVFVSEPAEGEARFRLSYVLDPAGVLKGQFAIAPPGTPDAFKPYLDWESRKATVIGK